jgi:6-pyruvoyltetrahydropterin/6-carboxytetrahydropterin synthase
MYRICKTYRFEAAHQLEEAVTQECRDTIHGHSYVVEVFLACHMLDDCDMVLDFGVLSQIVKPMINEWDHALLLPLRDSDSEGCWPSREGRKQKKVVFVEANPTAEWMAGNLYERISHALAHACGMDMMRRGLHVDRVRVHETVTGWAERVAR